MENLGVADVKARGTTALAALAALNKGIIRACWATGSIRGYTPVGGLVADNAGGISGCYSEVAVTGYSLVGGLAGRNEGTIENCYATGAVSGSAGLVGENTGMLSRCYAAGPVSGKSGGLVADNTGVVFDCFWDVDSSGQRNSAGGKGRPTAQMKQGATYLGWGSCGGAAWTCDEGIDYPRLAWETRRGAALPPRSLTDFLAGSGVPEDPYVVTTPEQFALLGAFPCAWDRNFRLAADLDLSGYPVAEYDLIGFDSSHAFTGAFEGGGHWIRNWTCVVDCGNVGLFGYIGPGGRITGLNLDNCTVTGGGPVGGLAGVNGGTLRDCHVVASLVRGTREGTGLLAGRNEGGVIASCSTAGSCLGTSGVGGLVGVLASGRATSCCAEAALTGSSEVGGLIGTNGGTVQSCRAGGTVSADRSAGGLIGSHSSGGWASNCYSLTVVTAREDTGGLIGECHYGVVTTCYAAGPVVGSGYSIGGLIGEAFDGSVVGSFWDITATGQAGSQGGLGKTTAQMQTASMFIDAGWDFENIWTIGAGQDYPRLQWEEVEP